LLHGERHDLAQIAVRNSVPEQEAQFSWTFLAILTVLSLIATAAYARAGFPAMWEAFASVRGRLVVPFGVGAAFGWP
jgi:hypothetical protein